VDVVESIIDDTISLIANRRSSISSIENPASAPSDAATVRNVAMKSVRNGTVTSTRSRPSEVWADADADMRFTG
jgi:hypothetical protein